ncbi:MAG: hypothetical protein PVF65_06030 [Sphingomonadales bacterium]|jgi:hypothetical protein
MAGIQDVKAKWEAVRSAAFGSVGATYAAIGDPLSNAAIVLHIRSTLDKDVYISMDGSTDHIYVGAGDLVVYDIGTNKIGDSKLLVPKGTQIYQKRGPGGASSSGNLFVMTLYGTK